MDELHIIESANEYGIIREFFIEENNLITKVTYDAEPMLRYAAAMRAETRGQRWGDGRSVGLIPFPVLNEINQRIPGSEERKRTILRYVRENPDMCTFEKFLK